MKKHMRCPACGRKRKPSHEKKCKTDKKHNPDCKVYAEFDSKTYRAELKAQIKARKVEQEEKVAKAKADVEKKIKEAADAKAKLEADAKAEAEKIAEETKAKAIAETEAKAKAKAEKLAKAEAEKVAKLETEIKADAEALKKVQAESEAEVITKGGIASVETVCTIPTPEQVKESVIEACKHTSNLVDQTAASSGIVEGTINIISGEPTLSETTQKIIEESNVASCNNTSDINQTSEQVK